jgi:hypothetical protein
LIGQLVLQAVKHQNRNRMVISSQISKRMKVMAKKKSMITTHSQKD